jgi:hypothetical protein
MIQIIKLYKYNEKIIFIQFYIMHNIIKLVFLKIASNLQKAIFFKPKPVFIPPRLLDMHSKDRVS